MALWVSCAWGLLSVTISIALCVSWADDAFVDREKLDCRLG